MWKRTFDIAASCAGLLLLSPVLIAISLIIKFTSPGPVFYRGRRVGQHGRPFRIFKYRSMVINAERIGGSSTSDDDPRITRIGRLLRKYKLDELPQLLNVLAGDMSVVGPRPEVQQYVDQYTAEEKAILQVRPGITDWASIWNSDEGAILKGHADPDKAYEELIRPTKLRLQLLYVRTQSLWSDLRIIGHTLLKLIGTERLPPELASVTALAKKESGKGRESDRSYATVTELPGHGATHEQMSMLHTRYHFAATLGRGKDVLELACGPGIALDYLQRTCRNVVGGDFDPELVAQALRESGARHQVQQIDAQSLPFADGSFDVILLLEALYYIPDARQFVAEAHRVLRPGGTIFICSANKERPDFNPSPFAYQYFTAAELKKLLSAEGFDVEVYAGFRVGEASFAGRLVGRMRSVAVKLHLIPRTMKWKILLKKLVFGKLEPIPTRLEVDEARCERLISIKENEPVRNYKVIYAVGRRAA